MRLGLAFNWKPNSPLVNPNNISIGSKETVYIDLGTSYQHQLNQHFSAGLGASIFHFSNGALKKPNQGINSIASKLSVVYHPGALR